MILATAKFIENVSCAELTRKDILKLLQSKTLKQMINLCLRKNGIGLSAIQVGIRQKFFVAFRPDIKVKGENNMGKWCVFFNPKYKVKNKEETFETIEGCLSYYPDKYKVKRYKNIIASWDEVDESRNIIRVEQKLTGAFSQIFQHEKDHCDNITIFKIGEKTKGEDNV